MPLAMCRPFGKIFSQSWRLHRKRCCNKLGSAVYFWVCGMSWDTMHFLNNEEPGCNEDWDIMIYIYIEIYMRSICIECFPEDTSTCQCHRCQDLPSMFGWKVRTAREAQQTSEEVRCSDYSDCVHCTRMHQFLLQRPRVRSCFWHGSISYDIWFIWCCTCERSNTPTQIHPVRSRCILCNLQWIHAGRCIWSYVLGFDKVIWCNMLICFLYLFVYFMILKQLEWRTFGRLAGSWRQALQRKQLLWQTLRQASVEWIVVGCVRTFRRATCS